METRGLGEVHIVSPEGGKLISYTEHPTAGHAGGTLLASCHSTLALLSSLYNDFFSSQISPRSSKSSPNVQISVGQVDMSQRPLEA